MISPLVIVIDGVETVVVPTRGEIIAASRAKISAEAYLTYLLNGWRKCSYCKTWKEEKQMTHRKEKHYPNICLFCNRTNEANHRKKNNVKET